TVSRCLREAEDTTLREAGPQTTLHPAAPRRWLPPTRPQPDITIPDHRANHNIHTHPTSQRHTPNPPQPMTQQINTTETPLYNIDIPDPGTSTTHSKNHSPFCHWYCQSLLSPGYCRCRFYQLLLTLLQLLLLHLCGPGIKSSSVDQVSHHIDWHSGSL
ncbi:unnamed protein product, partial [Meganyctiphanes norvegica]